MDDFEQIIKLIILHKKANPDLRFTQILFNLEITEFNNKNNPEKDDYLLRDNYNDSDNEVLKKILNNIKY